jgi:tRNA-2-methylthio-N6-dimethylallyladenosine synthase
MNRNYTIEHYLNIIDKARKIISGVSFSTDIIAGFPSETDKEHLETLNILKKIRFDGAYMFKYSPREGTRAYKMKDDITEVTKLKRLNEIIHLQQKISFEINQQLIGSEKIILVEGPSKKSDAFFAGRTDTNKVTIFPKLEGISIGDYIKVRITRATSATLFSDSVELYMPKEEKLARIA